MEKGDANSGPAAPERIRWQADEESAQQARPALHRGVSRGSLSINSVPSRNSIDAAAALPIQYRTL